MKYLLSRIFINPITRVLCLEFLTSQTNRLSTIFHDLCTWEISDKYKTTALHVAEKNCLFGIQNNLKCTKV